MHVMEESSTDQRFREMDGRFDRLEAALAASTAELRKEIKDSNAELRKEIQASNAELRKEFKASNAELRKEFKESYAELSGRMDKLQNTLLQVGGGLIGTMILFIGATQF
jgi:uncharacterized protein YdhG (YjbR/CyaY superfamily)